MLFYKWYASNSHLATKIRTSYRQLYRSVKESPTRRRIIRLLLHRELSPPTLFVFDELKLIYVEMAKCGSSAIKMTIGNSLGLGFETHLESWLYKEWDFVRGYKNLAPHQRDYFKFSFVRNPFDRVGSYYQDKILREPRNGKLHYRLSHDTFTPMLTNTSFEHVVNIICKSPDWLADRHYKSQSSYLFQKDKQMVDFIGQLENVKQDWAYIVAQVPGLSAPLIHAHRSTNRKQPKSYPNYYTRELADRIYDRYRQDFELLGYEDAYETLIARYGSNESMG